MTKSVDEKIEQLSRLQDRVEVASMLGQAIAGLVSGCFGLVTIGFGLVAVVVGLVVVAVVSAPAVVLILFLLMLLGG